MGQGALLAAAGLTVACFAAAAPAQGVATREAWAYLHLEARRAEVRRELLGRDDADRDVVARLLAKPDGGVPFAPIAAALAHLRGAVADDAFLLRTTMTAFVLPEVCDPEAANTACRDLHVSPFLPCTVPFPAGVRFELEVRTADGRSVWRGDITEATGERDVRMARPTIAVPGAQLADGAYDLVVRTVVGDAAPRAHDPVVQWRVHVLRGYQRRAEAAQAAAAARAGGADDDVVAAVVRAQAERVRAAFIGQPFVGRSDGVAELVALEQALAVDAKDGARLLAAGVDVPVAVPVGQAMPLPAVVRRAAGDGPRPLVVVVAGSPTYDGQIDRPMLPATRDPLWAARELSLVGGDDRWHMAFLASPGGGRDFTAALTAALPWLVRHLGARADRVALVAEREAATVAGLALKRLRAYVHTAVFVGGGAMMGPTIDACGDMAIGYVRLAGRDDEGVQRTIDYAAAQAAKAGRAPQLTWLPTAPAPWPFGLAHAQAPIAAFLRAALAGEPR